MVNVPTSQELEAVINMLTVLDARISALESHQNTAIPQNVKDAVKAISDYIATL